MIFESINSSDELIRPPYWILLVSTTSPLAPALYSIDIPERRNNLRGKKVVWISVHYWGDGTTSQCQSASIEIRWSRETLLFLVETRWQNNFPFASKFIKKFDEWRRQFVSCFWNPIRNILINILIIFLLLLLEWKFI